LQERLQQCCDMRGNYIEYMLHFCWSEIWWAQSQSEISIQYRTSPRSASHPHGKSRETLRRTWRAFEDPGWFLLVDWRWIAQWGVSELLLANPPTKSNLISAQWKNTNLNGFRSTIEWLAITNWRRIVCSSKSTVPIQLRFYGVNLRCWLWKNAFMISSFGASILDFISQVPVNFSTNDVFYKSVWSHSVLSLIFNGSEFGTPKLWSRNDCLGTDCVDRVLMKCQNVDITRRPSGKSKKERHIKSRWKKFSLYNWCRLNEYRRNRKNGGVKFVIRWAS
jgi:hypothetical protein